MPGIFELAANETWAIEPAMLETILAIAGRTNPDDPAAVAAKLGRPLANTRTVTERDGVAVIPVSGPLFRYANLFMAVSGATSMELLAQEFSAALESPTVRAILLEIDSPGGQVNGIADLAAQIYAARSVKPVVAYISGAGQSGGYWLASAASRVVVSPTALVGSIGVVATAPGAQPGNDIQFISNVSPNKRPNLQTATGLAQIQAQIDTLGNVFVAAVAKQRGISVERVLADFGQGGSFVGAGAVSAGLADAVGAFETTLAELAQRATGSFPKRAQGDSKMPKSYLDALAAGEVQPITAGELKQRHPETAQAISAEATAGLVKQADVQTAVAAERERIVALAAGMLGDEAGKKFAAAVAAGLTAEAAKELGVTLSAGSGKEAEMLAALKAAHGEGVKAAKIQKEAEDKGFMAMVKEYETAHECDLGTAMSAVQKAHPEAHAAYIAQANRK